MELGVVAIAFFGAVILFLVLIGAFFLGLHIGLSLASGGARGLMGIKKGSSTVLGQTADPLMGDDPLAAFVGKQFSPDQWAEEGGPVRGAMTEDEALKAVDSQVQRFIDSSIFGRGPRKGRTGDADDDD